MKTVGQFRTPRGRLDRQESSSIYSIAHPGRKSEPGSMDRGDHQAGPPREAFLRVVLRTRRQARSITRTTGEFGGARPTAPNVLATKSQEGDT